MCIRDSSERSDCARPTVATRGRGWCCGSFFGERAQASSNRSVRPWEAGCDRPRSDDATCGGGAVGVDCAYRTVVLARGSVDPFRLLRCSRSHGNVPRVPSAPGGGLRRSVGFRYAKRKISRHERRGVHWTIVTVLILGGTRLARELVRSLDDAGISIVSSLAGRIAEPTRPVGPTRIGGFGGAPGLVRWVTEHEVSAVVDATHPFAATMSMHAASAAAQTGIPLLVLEPPSWRGHP